MHWGAEYQAKPNKTQTDLAHWFIDQGVDAIIGSHPHWMESVEVYRNRPIAYSLGNFIFDQDWSAETNLGLAAGLVLNEQGSELHLFPIQITKSQPRLLTGTDRQTRLDYLASISDPSLSSQIKQGVIRLINK
jgi:poly-gamma-glutamate synthesis protein (capsule biosynthesis protein)